WVQALAPGLPRLDRLQALLRLRAPPARADDAGPARLRTQPARPGLRHVWRRHGPLGQGHRRLRPTAAHGADRPRVRLGRADASDLDLTRAPEPLHDGRSLRSAVAK